MLPARMTLSEFLSWDAADPSGVAWQLVDGEPIAMAPGSETHAALQGEIGRQIANHLIEHRSPCRLLSQPGIVPRVRANRNFRIPDLGVTSCPAFPGSDGPRSCPADRDPVPSNEAQTRANIWAYTTIPSVREILAVHSTRIEAELLRRGTDGNWPGGARDLHRFRYPDARQHRLYQRLAAFYRTTALAS